LKKLNPKNVERWRKRSEAVTEAVTETMSNKKDEALTFSEEAQFVALYSVLMSLYLVPFIILAIIYFMLSTGFSTFTFTVVVICLVDLLIPLNIGHSMTNTTRNALDYRAISRKYYPVTMMNENSEYDPSKNYIVTLAPHGVIPLHASLVCDWFYERKWKIRSVAASVLFKMPLMRRWIVTISNAIPATAKDMVAAMTGVKHQIIQHTVGGISEMFLGFDHEEVIVRRRRGWLRIAIKTGYHIIPTYGIGVNRAYTRLVKQGTLLQRISKRFQMSLTPFFGRFPFVFAPRRYPLVVCVGKPIPVEQKDDPTKEDVDRLLETYSSELRRIYNKGVKLHPDQEYWANRELLFEGDPGHPLDLLRGAKLMNRPSQRS